MSIISSGTYLINVPRQKVKSDWFYLDGVLIYSKKSGLNTLYRVWLSNSLVYRSVVICISFSKRHTSKVIAKSLFQLCSNQKSSVFSYWGTSLSDHAMRNLLIFFFRQSTDYLRIKSLVRPLHLAKHNIYGCILTFSCIFRRISRSFYAVRQRRRWHDNYGGTGRGHEVTRSTADWTWTPRHGQRSWHGWYVHIYFHEMV